MDSYIFYSLTIAVGLLTILIIHFHEPVSLATILNFVKGSARILNISQRKIRGVPNKRVNSISVENSFTKKMPSHVPSKTAPAPQLTKTVWIKKWARNYIPEETVVIVFFLLGLYFKLTGIA